MIKKIKDIFNSLDDITYKIMKKGLKFSFLITIISTFILLTYIVFTLSPIIYYIGFKLCKLSIYFIIEFIVCGIVVDNIKKQII